ncbi:hypothetical protein CPB84DRAFT_1783396 [Gymnopilus junonius]|uniref:Uncharacterized protein n=1 Tax=Gymnopilus junonius TaxID=109634 RepID=A0A9P5TKM1_GYMJU|nr:hypothetical protein CPB84DRAFT_1783396 [Gymnopilus junonius]
MRCPDTLLIVLKHLPRIQHLNVTLGLPLWQKQQAPSIGAEQRRQILIPEQENLFGGWAPGLRQFHMQYCAINLSPKMYSGLRGLYLDMLHLISPVQLLNALRNMTHLEYLHLARAPEIRLAKSISVSAGIFKNLGCYHASDETLSIWECEQLVGATSMAVTVEVPGVDELSTSIHLTSALHYPSIFQSCEAPPDSLVVYADTKLPTQLRNLFAQWLRKMDVIQSIELHSNAAFSLLKLRCDVFGDDADVGPGSAYDTYGGYEEDAILLPFLTDLTLVNVNFPTERRRYWKRLMNTLKLRQDAGYPLMLVDFVNCMGNFDLREVGRYVTEVKKDGDDYNDSDDDDSSNDSDYTIQADSDAELT